MQAAYGETLKVVGSGSVGAWDAAAASKMRWADGHIWVLDLDLPEHAGFEYKIVHMHCNGMSWESCQNRQASTFTGVRCLDPHSNHSHGKPMVALFQMLMLRHFSVKEGSIAAPWATNEALWARRLFQAGPGLPEQAALDISCAFNYPELTIVQLAALDTLPSLEGKDPWDPAARRLPADLTEELSKLVCLT